MGIGSSVFELLRLPVTFQVLLCTFFFILLLAPYFSGSNFGLFQVPTFTPRGQKRLRLMGPALFALVLGCFVPLTPASLSIPSHPPPILLEPELEEEVISLHGALRWDVDPEVDVLRYEVQLSQSENFSHSEKQVVARPFLPFTRVEELARSLPIQNEKGKVHWRVRAVLPDGEEGAWSEPGAFFFFSDSLDRIRRRGLIRIATSSTQDEEIFAFLDAHNRWTGLDIELVREIAGRIGRELNRDIQLDPRVVTKPWEQLLTLPRSREVDLVISSITISAQRKELHGIAFSDPYFATQQSLVSPNDRQLSSWESLRGKRVGVQNGTTGYTLGEFLKSAAGSTLVTMRSPDSIGKMYRALEAGEIDALLVDEPYARKRNVRARLAIWPLGPDLLPDEYDGPRTESYGIVTHPEDHRLLSLVNNAIAELRAEGYLASLRDEFIPR